MPGLNRSGMDPLDELARTNLLFLSLSSSVTAMPKRKTIRKRPAKRKRKPGPPPERVKIEGNWENAIGHAISRPRPKSGWPKLPSPPPPPRFPTPPSSTE
jgi:hypothetical protein